MPFFKRKPLLYDAFVTPSYWQRLQHRMRSQKSQWRKSSSTTKSVIAGIMLFLILAVVVDPPKFKSSTSSGKIITCSNPSITDGDTFRCDGTRIRMAGIDAPEMPGHCRKGRQCTPGDPFAAKKYLQELTRGDVTCKRTDTDHYGRTVAICTSEGKNLSCEMIKSGHAIQRYGGVSCF